MAPKKDVTLVDVKKAQDAAKKVLAAHESRLKDYEARMNALETKVEAIEESHNRITKDLEDLRRQQTKVCVSLTGKDLPKRSVGEDPVKIFVQKIQEKYDIHIKHDELATVHRQSNGGLLARFIKHHIGSGYHRLVVRRGRGERNPNSNLTVFANILLTRHDARLRFLAATAKRVGTILFVETLLSGKIGITVNAPGTDRKKNITINEYQDLKPYMTEEVLKEVEKANKERRRRRNGRQPDNTGSGTTQDPIINEYNDLIANSHADDSDMET